MAERYGLTETEWNARLDGIQHTAERAHAEIALHAGLLAAHDGRLTEREKDVEHLLGRVRAAEDDIADLHARLTEAERAAKEHLDALGASVGIVRADLAALQAQEPVRVLLARLEALSDERNAARRDLMRVADERDQARAYAKTAENLAFLHRSERDTARVEAQRADDRFNDEWRRAEALRTERDALKAERETLATPQVLDAIQEATLYRAVVTRVRSGDLVRCLTCEGRGHCADCEDDHGAARYGVPGLVPPAANAPLVSVEAFDAATGTTLTFNLHLPDEEEP